MEAKFVLMKIRPPPPDLCPPTSSGKKIGFKMLYKGMSMRKSRPRHSCVCTFTLALSCLKLQIDTGQGRMMHSIRKRSLIGQISQVPILNFYLSK